MAYTRRRRITIIGGGISGLTTSLSFHKLGVRADVYERAGDINEVGAGILLQPNAMQVLDWIGLGDRIRERGQVLQSFVLTNKKLVSVRKSPPILPLISGKSSLVCIHRARLQQVLFDALPAGYIHLGRPFKTMEKIEDRMNITCGEDSIKTDVLLGADGIHSQVRELLFPGSKERYAGQTCWRGIASLGLPEQYKKSGYEAWGPRGRFGFAPISDKEVYWFAVSKARRGGKDNPETIQQELQERYGRFHTLVNILISNTPQDQIMRNDILDLQRLDRWYSGSVCLIGDAAHATSPNMGQGAGQGIEDAYYLSQFLQKISDNQEAFRQFEYERRKKVDHVVNTSWRIGKMAHHLIGRRAAMLALRLSSEKKLKEEMKKIYTLKDAL